jgi:hypothetical protein
MDATRAIRSNKFVFAYSEALIANAFEYLN